MLPGLLWQYSPTALHWAIPLAGLAALVLWSLIEYAMHRFAFHGVEPFVSLHAGHHRRPLALVATPTLVSATVIALLVWLPATLLGGLWMGSGVALGVVTGYFAYGVVHHGVHHWRAKGVWMRRCKRQHAIHHLNPRINYGVTMLRWDRAFGSHKIPINNQRWGRCLSRLSVAAARGVRQQTDAEPVSQAPCLRCGASDSQVVAAAASCTSARPALPLADALHVGKSVTDKGWCTCWAKRPGATASRLQSRVAATHHKAEPRVSSSRLRQRLRSQTLTAHASRPTLSPATAMTPAAARPLAASILQSCTAHRMAASTKIPMASRIGFSMLRCAREAGADILS